jgi:uncharacterized iron-regulated membrane protein
LPEDSTVPLNQQYLMDLIAPPIGAVLWWIRGRGWAAVVQMGTVSERTKRRQRFECLVVLGLLYALMFGTTTYLKVLAN